MAAVLAAVIVLTAACSSKTAYSRFCDLPLSGWDKDSTLVYAVDIKDTLQAYDVVLTLRHGENYPYQNIWLFVDNGLTMQTDTLEFYLADQRGRWLGNGFGDRREMPCLVASQVRFPHAGTYVYQVRQGMREEVLKGLFEVGLSIEQR